MDVVRLFISDVLLNVVSSNHFQFFNKNLILSKHFHDIDMYVTWAEKRLERTAKGHLEGFFKEDSSLDEYYSVLHKLRVSPQILQTIRTQLEVVFPFMQRMSNPQRIVLQYIDMLEMLYDTLKEEPKVQVPKRIKAAVTESDDEPAAEIPEAEGTTQEAEIPEAEGTTQEAEIPEAEGTTQEVEIPAADSEEEGEPDIAEIIEPTNVAADKDKTKDPEESLEEISKIEEPSNISENKPAENVDTVSDDDTSSVKAESLQSEKERCKALGILFHKNKNYSDLLAQFDKGSLSSNFLAKKGLKALIKRKDPSQKNLSTKNRAQLIKLYEETNGENKD